MNKPSIIMGIVLILILGFAVFNFQKQKNPNTKKTEEIIASVTPLQNITPISPPVTITQGTVPLPQETDIIRTFFNLIQERKISDAVMMMSDSITKDDSTKQAWGVQLNAFKSVKVLDITPSMPEEWKGAMHTYKVTLDVVMDPDSAGGSIPYFGYENGTNIRWITLEKSGTLWKVTGIATGP